MDTVSNAIEKDASGEQAARVAALFREHNRALTAYLHCRLNSFSDAQEVAQETYVRMLTLECADKVVSQRAYLFRIASNLAIDKLRMRKVRLDIPVDMPADDLHQAPVPERYVSTREQWRDLRTALRELPAKTNQAFVMHMIEGIDFPLVAQTMKLSERMVRYHVTHALAHCRARVDELEMP